MLSLAKHDDVSLTNAAERAPEKSVAISWGPEIFVKAEVGFRGRTDIQQGFSGGTLMDDAKRKVFKVVKNEERLDTKVSSWEAILQSWEGRVVHEPSEDGIFTAIITDRTNRNNPDEIVEIDLQHVKESDRSLVRSGAIFYWNMGRFRTYKDGRIGPSVNHFEIRFRRLPPLSPEVLEGIRRTSARMASRLHGD
jgi:hypothetical protein